MSSLLEQLGLDENFFYWRDLATCRNLNGDLFFEGYDNERVAKAVDEVCFACPVQQECGVEGLTQKREGVWGGVYFNGQGKADPDKNAHKAPDVLRELMDRFSG